MFFDNKYLILCSLLVKLGIEVPPLTRKQVEEGHKNLVKLIKEWKKYVNERKINV